MDYKFPIVPTWLPQGVAGLTVVKPDGPRPVADLIRIVLLNWEAKLQLMLDISREGSSVVSLMSGSRVAVAAQLLLIFSNARGEVLC